MLLNNRHAGHSQALLVVAEIESRRVARRVWEEEEAIQRDRDGEEAVNDEQPAPSCESAAAIEAGVNARLDEAANHGAGQARRGEDAAALAQLALCIPGTEDVMRADKGRRFKDALEEANDHDGLGLVDRGRDHGEAAPDEHHRGEPDTWLDIVQGEVRRDLAQHVAMSAILSAGFALHLSLSLVKEDKVGHLPNCEASVDYIELVANKAQVFSHARDICIGQVRAVQLAGVWLVN